MKTILIVVLLLSLLLNGWLLWDRREAQNERFADNSRLNDIISSKQAEISNADTIISTIRQKSRERAAKDSALVGALKGRVSGLRKKLAELGEITPQEVADTTCTRLIQVSQLKDSVIAKQDDLISTLELSHAAEVVDLEVIIHEQSRQIMAQAAISDAWRQTAEQTQADVAKERRRKGFWKVTSAVLAAGVVIISLKE